MPDNSWNDGWHVRLSCDRPSHTGFNYSAEDPVVGIDCTYDKRADYLRAARKLGWTFDRDGTVTCPNCRKVQP